MLVAHPAKASFEFSFKAGQQPTFVPLEVPRASFLISTAKDGIETDLVMNHHFPAAPTDIMIRSNLDQMTMGQPKSRVASINVGMKETGVKETGEIKELERLRQRSESSYEGRPACDHCRRRKIRCDRILPTCGTCSKLGRVCSTNDVLMRRGPPSNKEKAAYQAAGLEIPSLKYRHRARRAQGVNERSDSGRGRPRGAGSAPALTTYVSHHSGPTDESMRGPPMSASFAPDGWKYSESGSSGSGDMPGSLGDRVDGAWPPIFQSDARGRSYTFDESTNTIDTIPPWLQHLRATNDPRLGPNNMHAGMAPIARPATVPENGPAPIAADNGRHFYPPTSSADNTSFHHFPEEHLSAPSFVAAAYGSAPNGVVTHHISPMPSEGSTPTIVYEGYPAQSAVVAAVASPLQSRFAFQPPSQVQFSPYSPDRTYRPMTADEPVYRGPHQQQQASLASVQSYAGIPQDRTALYSANGTLDKPPHSAYDRTSFSSSSVFDDRRNSSVTSADRNDPYPPLQQRPATSSASAGVAWNFQSHGPFDSHGARPTGDPTAQAHPLYPS